MQITTDEQLSRRKNVLVTGGAGFIGSHLCDELIKQGNNVICVDSFITGTMKNIEFLIQVPNFKFVKHDIIEPLDLESLSELKVFQLNTLGIEEIYNLDCRTSYKWYKELPL